MRRSKPVCRVLAAVAGVLASVALVPQAASAPPAAGAGIPVPVRASQGSLAGLPAAITPEVIAPRVAYTEDTTELVVREVFAEGGAPDRIIAGAGQGSSSPDLGNLAYVGTKDQDQGEVYFRPSLTDPAEVRVTCDASVQTHPVVSPDGRFVAYASNETGSFQIWVAQVDNGPGTWDCTTLPRVQLTHSAGDNLWPAWAGVQRVVFSSTRADPLGDIVVMPFAGIGVPASDAAAQRLTDAPAAETQPTTVVLPDNATGVSFLAVVFTTTAFRPDGSLAWLRMPNSTDPGPFPVASVWGSAPAPQGERASVLNTGGTARLAFTSTQADPYGDVRVVTLDPDQRGTVTVLPRPDNGVAAEPGRAESDPAWARVVVPDVSEFTYVVFTRHTQSADIADVVAADGSGRRVIASATLGSGDAAGPSDEGTPAYSPDGLRIAYSRSTREDLARELVTSAADGSDVQVLVPSRAPFDIDIQPAWSPDGTQVAFVRYPFAPNVEQWGPGQIWVVTVATGVARRVSQPGKPGYLNHDEHPSWSPDGTRVVIARSVERLAPDIEVRTTLALATALTGSAVDGTVSVANIGPGTTEAEHVVVHISGPSIVGGAPPMAVTSTDARCATETAGLACDLGPFAPGVATTIAVRVTPPAAGTYHLAAQVPQVAYEVATANNAMFTQLTVTNPPPNIAVALALPNPLAGPGTLTVSTTAPTPIPGTVTVDLTAPVFDTSAPPDRRKVGLFFTAVPAGCVITSDYVVPGGGVIAEQHFTIAIRCTLVAPTPGGSVTLSLPLAGTSTTTLMSLRAVALAVPNEANTADNTAEASTVTPPIVPPKAVVNPAFLRADVAAADTLRGDLGTVERAQSPRGSRLVGSPATVRPVPVADPPSSPTQLWVLDVTTGDAVQLFAPAQSCPPTLVCNPVPLTGRQPAWAPDGPRVAFEDQGMVFVATLLDANADGIADVPERVGGIAAVTGFGTTATPTPTRPVLSAATDPAWSPDAAELAVAGQPAGQPDMWGIYALRPDGTGLRVIAQRPGNPETEPTWQPYADLAVTLAALPPTIATGASTTMTATVRNAGPAGAAAVRLRVEMPVGMTPGTPPAGCTLAAPLLTCAVGLLAKGASASFAIALRGTTAGTFVGTAVVDSPTPDPRPMDNTATASVVVVQPVLRIDPNVVVPGQVTMASGSNFPPGAQVTLTWDTGLTEPRPPVTVLPDGTIAPTQILIFRRDPLGNRQLVATSVVPGGFDPVTAGGLVAPPPQEPPDFVERR